MKLADNVSNVYARVKGDRALDVVEGKVDGHAQNGARTIVTNRSMDLVPTVVAGLHVRIALKTFFPKH